MEGQFFDTVKKLFTTKINMSSSYLNLLAFGLILVTILGLLVYAQIENESSTLTADSEKLIQFKEKPPKGYYARVLHIDNMWPYYIEKSYIKGKDSLYVALAFNDKALGISCNVVTKTYATMAFIPMLTNQFVPLSIKKRYWHDDIGEFEEVSVYCVGKPLSVSKSYHKLYNKK